MCHSIGCHLAIAPPVFIALFLGKALQDSSRKRVKFSFQFTFMALELFCLTKLRISFLGGKVGNIRSVGLDMEALTTASLAGLNLDKAVTVSRKGQTGQARAGGAAVLHSSQLARGTGT